MDALSPTLINEDEDSLKELAVSNSPSSPPPNFRRSWFKPDVITADFSKRSTFGWVPTNALEVDPFYQRTLKAGKVSKMAHNWDTDLCGVFVVNYRNGKYYVIDGQHRHAALKRLENYPNEVFCEVFEHLTMEQEAALFYLLDTKRDNLTPAARFKALLASSDEAALDIKEVAETAGFSVDPSGINTYDSHHLRAFNTLLDIHKRIGKAGLGRILLIANSSWADRKDAGSEPILKGMELFLQKYPSADQARLIRTLEATTPMIIVGSARRLQEDLSSSIYGSVGQIIRGLYNKKLRNKLADW